MEVLIFKTDISSSHSVKPYEWVFNQHPSISNWNVDFQDVDKVLRIEALDHLKENDVIDLMRTFGFHCEILPD